MPLPKPITNLQQSYGEYALNTPMMQFVTNLGKFIGEPIVRGSEEVQRLLKQRLGQDDLQRQRSQMSEPEYRQWLLEQRDLGKQLAESPTQNQSRTVLGNK